MSEEAAYRQDDRRVQIQDAMRACIRNGGIVVSTARPVMHPLDWHCTYQSPWEY